MSKRKFALSGLAALSVMAFASTFAYGFYRLDWGCPSPEDLERPIPTREVLDAFDQEGLELEPVRVPVSIPAGAQAYRSESEIATLFVVVCADACAVDASEAVFTTHRGSPQRMRHGIVLGNVDIWITDADRRSYQALVAQVSPVVDELDRSPGPGDRCYVG